MEKKIRYGRKSLNGLLLCLRYRSDCPPKTRDNVKYEYFFSTTARVVHAFIKESSINLKKKKQENIRSSLQEVC